MFRVEGVLHVADSLLTDLSSPDHLLGQLCAWACWLRLRIRAQLFGSSDCPSLT